MSDTTPRSPAVATPERPPRAGGGFIAVYVLAYLGLYVAVMTPLLASLAIRLQQIDPTGKEVALGLVIGVGTLVNIVAGPIVGLLSDNTVSRLGRRRPWMLAGMPLLVIGAVLAAVLDSVPGVLLGYVVGQVGVSFVMTPLMAVMPDQVPEEQRGVVGGLLGFTAQIAGVAGFQFAGAPGGSPLPLFLVPALVACATVLLLVVVMPDRRLSEAERGTLDLAGLVRDLGFDPRRHPDFAWTWLGRFLIQFSLMFLSTYQLYFLTDHLGYELVEVTGLLAISGGAGLLMTSVGAIASGYLSDRLRRRKPFVYLAVALFVVGFVIIAFASSFAPVLVGSQFILLGAGMFGAVDLAVVADVLPNRETEAGKYMSIFGIAGALPQSAAPVVAPFVLAVGGGANYPLLFLVAAGVAVAGGLSVRPIKGIR
ncbi:MFS family permease [Streptosporangium becharense]|uniref:MFS family permease n=1 Tax=Streptosporangium becharense TaxID=1816182 RepID=A0A7W9IMD9_9ACTN|nr:MFS transporter [Streptosporangium becharense]MBB2910267.1 MFS family permease [Streptosporangium becharense]MBB5823010.1 MFS family permease [Streptosporangium becharense]